MPLQMDTLFWDLRARTTGLVPGTVDDLKDDGLVNELLQLKLSEYLNSVL